MRYGRLKAWCRLMSGACLCLVVALAVAAIAPWIWFDGARESWGIFSEWRVTGADAGTGTRILGALVGAIPAGLVAYGLLRLARVFAEFADGRVFSRRSVGDFRAFAFSVLAVSVLYPLAKAVQGLVLTAAAPDVATEFALTFQAGDAQLFVLGGLLASLSVVFRYGEDLADEQAHIL